MPRKFQNQIMRSQSVGSLLNPASNAGKPQQQPQMQPQMQQQQQQQQEQQPQQYNQQQEQTHPGNDRNFAEKLLANVPQYLMRRIFANINTIHDLVMGGGWHEPQFKMLLKNEIQQLTKNLKDPSLQRSVNELTDAADVPLTLFVKNFTEIIQKHIKDITNKITNMVVNLIGEIPGVNVVTNSVLAASNAVHVAKNVTEIGKELVENIQTFKNDITAVIHKFNPSMNQQFGPQMMQQINPSMIPNIGQMTQLYPQQSQQSQQSQPLQYGGLKIRDPRNMKDAKKHLHHLHRKKNRTLRRIHHSIHQFLSSNRNKRSIKANTKH